MTPTSSVASTPPIRVGASEREPGVVRDGFNQISSFVHLRRSPRMCVGETA